MPFSSRTNSKIENTDKTTLNECNREKGGENSTALTNKEKFCFSVGHIQNDLQAFAALSYILLFLTKVIGLQNDSTGTIFLVAQVTDGILSPLLGFLCDRYDFPGLKKFGKRKAWHMFGVAVLVVFSPFLFVRCLACELAPDKWRESVAVGYYSFIVIAIHFGFAAVQISHLALLPDIAQQSSDHVKLNSLRSAWTFISGLFVYGVFWLLLGKSSGDKLSSKDQNEFMYLGFIIVVVGLVFTFVFYAGVNENKIRKQYAAGQTDTINQASSTNAGYEKDMATARNTSNSIHQPDDNLEQILNVNSLSELNKHVELRTSTEDSSSTTCTVPNGLPIQVPPQSCKTEDMTDTNVMQDSIQELPRENIVQENQVIGHDINNISMKTKIKNWFRRPRFFMVGFIYMCSRVVLNISSAYFPFYLEESLNFEKEAIAYFPLIVLVSSALFSWVAKKIGSHWNSYVAYCIAAFMAIGAFHWLHFQPIGGKNAVYGASLLMGGGVAMMLVTALTMVAVLIDDKDRTTGAFVYGFMGLTDKVANGVIVHLIQKYKPKTQKDGSCPTCGEYIRLAFPLVAGAAAFLSMLVVVVLFVHRKRKKTNDNEHISNNAVVCAYDNTAVNDATTRQDGDLKDKYDTRL